MKSTVRSASPMNSGAVMPTMTADAVPRASGIRRTSTNVSLTNSPCVWTPRAPGALLTSNDSMR